MTTQNDQHGPIPTQRLQAMRRQLIDYNKGLAPKPTWDDEAQHQLQQYNARLMTPAIQAYREKLARR